MNTDIAILRSAISGITQLIAGRGLQVTQQGTQAYVTKCPKTHKPVRVNIPHLPDNSSPALVRAIQGFIDHECGHILDTDYAVWHEAEKFAAELGVGQVGFTLWNIVEDTYIERAMAKRFPGTRHNLDQLHQFFVAEITTPSLKKAGSDHAMIFNLLLVPMCRAWAGQPVFEAFMKPLWPLVADEVTKIGALKDRFPGLANSQQCLELAKAVHAALYPPKAKEAALTPAPPPPKPGKEKGEAGESGAPSKDDKAEKGEGKGKKAKPELKPEPKAEEPKDDDAAEDEGLSDDPADDDAPAPGEKEPEAEKDDAKADPADEGDEPADDDGLEGADDAEGKDEDEGPGEPGAGEHDEKAGGEPGEDDGDDAGEGGKISRATPPLEEGEGTWTEEDQKNHLTVEHEKVGDGEGSGGTPDKTLGPTPLIDGSVAGFDEAIAIRISKDAVEASIGSPYLIYTKDFDAIEPYKVSRKFEDYMLTNLEDETRSMVGVMQKDIERMMAARSAVTRVGGFRSGRLRGGALHRLRVSDDRVFERKQTNTSKEVAVTLLVDCSGSMSGGRKINTAMTAAFALSSTLERVGIKHEVLGFTTGTFELEGGEGTPGREIDPERLEEDQRRIGRPYTRTEAIMMPIFKAENERLTSEVKRRFADAPHHMRKRNNIDGESLEYAALRLAGRRADRKVLMVLSDGNPACHGDNWALERHLKAVTAQIEKMGIECIGIGIQDDSVRKFYKKHLVLNDVAQLPALVMGELRRILTAA